MADPVNHWQQSTTLKVVSLVLSSAWADCSIIYRLATTFYQVDTNTCLIHESPHTDYPFEQCAVYEFMSNALMMQVNREC